LAEIKFNSEEKNFNSEVGNLLIQKNGSLRWKTEVSSSKKIEEKDYSRADKNLET
jgi:hypothetical protein